MSEREKLVDLIFDAFNQACQVQCEPTFEFDHMFTSTWEEIQDFLLKEKRITLEQCRRK